VNIDVPVSDIEQLQESVAGTTRASLQPRIELVARIHELVDRLAWTRADDSALHTATDLVAAASRAVAAGTPQPGYVRAVDGVVTGLTPVSERGPFTSPLHVTAPRFTVTIDDGDDGRRVTAETTYGNAFEGARGWLQGGFMAAAFDEILGLAQAGARRVTVRLELEYHSPAKLHVPVRYTSWIDKLDGRKAFVVGELHQQDRLCATARALFVQPRPRARDRSERDE
jgi:acyl-coenzyme A thioesterase PaaI-like protein